jgi:hypothetical protein
MRYHVQVGTTSILHRDLNDLARRLQSSIEGAGYVRDPTTRAARSRSASPCC